ncbi:hypothetical protein [Flagellimonas nanhaiensis]|uniref:hypothetical protein n=1 Tax=Flagellimonas nanhaiensis TaxID=2292706 RepID=UPI0011C05911|nr:hypothetical protein [Allomuricauda nanhaiensis]
MVNSAVLYALTYNLIFFLQEVFLVLGKKVLGLESYLYHNNHTWEGEHPMMYLMQGSGALAIFLIGLICLVIYSFIKNSQSIWKLLVLWLAFHGLVQSIPQVTVAYLAPSTDVGEALVGYLNLSQPLLIALALICIFTTPMLNIMFSRLLLEFAPKDVDLNNPKARFRYIRFIAVGAALVGGLLIVPFRVPPIRQAITPFIVFVYSIPWIWSSVNVTKHVKHTPNRIDEKIYWAPIALLILLLIFFQLVLAPGVEF